MPNLDLRNGADRNQFDPLAHFKLLSVMLHPRDREARANVMSSVRAELGLSGQRTRPLTSEESIIAQEFGASRGGEAGFMMMALIQLHAHGFRPTLGKAVDLIRMELPEFDPAWWTPEHSHQHLPRHVGKLRKIFQQFGGVAHFWAALVHEQQRDQWRLNQGEKELGNLLPISLDRLPQFLATAENIWDLYSQLPIRRGSSPDRAHVSIRWTMTLPEGVTVTSKLAPLRIPKDRLERLTR